MAQPGHALLHYNLHQCACNLMSLPGDRNACDPGLHLPIALHTGLCMLHWFCKHLMSTGLEPTSYAWLPQSLYIGCASGSVVIVDTVTASKTRQQAQRSSQAGAVPGPALGPQPVEDLPGLGTAEETSLPVVAALEYGGQLIHIEALAVNKDCVAVAGHCPIIR